MTRKNWKRPLTSVLLESAPGLQTPKSGRRVILEEKTRKLTYAPRQKEASWSHFNFAHTNFALARGDMAVIDNVLMNLANPNLGTLLYRASSSQVVQASQESLMKGAGWVSVQGSKLEA
jgi:hypothetical protein